MANQNLSQFGENTSVSDADYTFVWDSAASISKKVSRNSWLNSGTLTSDAPVTISQTWNALAVAFTALKVNATSTNSAAASKLLDLQVGGVSKSKVDKGGFITAAGVFVNVVGKAISNPAGQELGFGYTNNGCAFYRYSTAIASFVNSASVGGNSSGLNLGTDALGFASSAEGALSVVLLRDGADNTLALRNGANAQTFNVYGTYTSGTSYERLTLSAPTAANAIIGTNKGSGGGTARGLEFQTDGVSRWSISTSGHLLGATDNTYDIGASGASRPRDIHVGRYLILGSTGAIGFSSRSYLKSPSDGVMTLINTAETDFNRLQFGGTTNLFPAIKRSTTYLQARLADDSAFAPIQGKLTTDTAFTAGAITDTGYIVLYDSAGVAYKVACTPV